MPFIAIREFRELVKSSFHVTSRADLDILIDLAAATQFGEGLTMKQLVILHGGSATTTRRRLNNLILGGKVVKLPNDSDGRSEVYGVSTPLWQMSAAMQTAMKEICSGFQSRLHSAEIAAQQTAKGVR